MKYLKLMGLAAIAAAALMALAGTASATIITSPSGTQYSGTLKTELNGGEAILKSSFIGEVKCKKSTVEGKIETQGAEVTASGRISTLDFTECNGVVTPISTEEVGGVKYYGSLEAHTEYKEGKVQAANNNGTLTSKNTEVTVELAGLHCIFRTSATGTELGLVTGGTPATFKAESAAIPRTGGRSGAFCGSSAFWNANYKVVTPGSLFID